jgi:hypothetical protein
MSASEADDCSASQEILSNLQSHRRENLKSSWQGISKIHKAIPVLNLLSTMP